MSTTPDPTPFDASLESMAPQATPLADPAPGKPSLGGDPLLATPDSATVESEPEPAVTPTAANLAAARRESDLKALYAFAGFTELAVGAVRSTVTDTSRWANARLSELRFRREELTKQAEEVRKIAEGLPEDVKAVPDVAKGRVTELQEQATSTYSDLASRGQRVLSGVRSDVAGRIDPAFDRIQERIDAARRAIKARAAAAAAAPAPVAEEVVVPEAVLVDETVVAEPGLVTDPAPVEDVTFAEPDVEYPTREA